MTISQRIKFQTAEDILGYIPHALGFWPADSLVMITMQGTRLGATLRVDLPDPDKLGRGAGRDYAEQVCAYLRADEEATGVLAVLYTGHSWDHPAHPPFARLMKEVSTALSRLGLPLRDGWLVGDTCWRNYYCSDPGCCPWPGAELNRITDGFGNAEMVYRGSAYAPSPEDVVGTWPPAEAPAEATAGAESGGGVVDCPAEGDENESDPAGESPNRGEGSGVRAAVAALTPRIRCRRAGHWLDEESFAAVLSGWERAFDGAGAAGLGAGAGAARLGAGAGGPAGAALLLASLDCKAVRDAVLVQATVSYQAAIDGVRGIGLIGNGVGEMWDGSKPDDAARNDAAVEGSESEMPVYSGPERLQPAADDFGAILIGESATRPDWARADSAYRTFIGLLQVADRQAGPPLLTMLGWLEWARGRGSHADTFLRRCLSIAPDYELARLLRELLDRGYLNGWARCRQQAWHPPIAGTA